SDRDWSSDVCSSDLRSFHNASGVSKSVPLSVVGALLSVFVSAIGLPYFFIFCRRRDNASPFSELYKSSAHTEPLASGCLRSRLRSEERRVGKECCFR